jgi:sulfhydrogenase subunit beta (sulfur reductase)
METFLKEEDVFKFYDCIGKEYELYTPTGIKGLVKKGCNCEFPLPSDEYCFARYSSLKKEEIVFNDYRCQEPLRSFFAHFKEEACVYFKDAPAAKAEKPVAICGVKNCDLFSLKIQDYVFLEGDSVDPLYQKRREEALIISSDCPAFKESCFCRAFGINPHVNEGFDFNLSPLTDGYLVAIGSEKAARLAESMRDILRPATLGQISGRASKRESMIKRMEEHLARHKIPPKESLQEIVQAGYDSPVWSEEMRTCVECGGCVFICDTCHCFLLADEEYDENTKRLKVWDGCLFKNFTRVAGGANPLKMRYMRLRNRYLKKFDFFISNLGIQGCCGCGRCIDVCPGRIDIRKILRRLYEEKYIPAG